LERKRKAVQIGITGATGLIGELLTRRLSEAGHDLVLFSRSLERGQSFSPDSKIVQWDALASPLPEGSLDGLDALVHLLGEGIANGRWTAARKKLIRDSRVKGTRSLVEELHRCQNGPRVLVSASAIGLYGNRGEESLDETSQTGKGFLPSVCKSWEQEASLAAEANVRTVLLRTGIVLSTRGGALAKMLLPFRLCFGGPLGPGNQWMSWIHLEDQIGLILHALERDEVEGPLNATAPNPVKNRAFSKALGRALGRPAITPTPGFVLKLMLGEMAQALLLEGQKVLPSRAIATGYRFRFPEIHLALQDLLKRQF